jgi:hypothetical protein
MHELLSGNYELPWRKNKTKNMTRDQSVQPTEKAGG